MIPRAIAALVLRYAGQYPIVTITGPRQSGKTTLSRALFPDRPYVSLEDIEHRRFASEDPRGFLARYRDGVVIDEIQRAAGLSSYLQTEVDLDDLPGRFILTGSQQFELMESVSQSLAGRTAVVRLLPFSMEETEPIVRGSGLFDCLYRGFFPRVIDRGLNPTEAMSFYVSTYLERDLRQLVNVRDLTKFETFLGLLAGRSGQLVNASALAGDCGVSQNTIRQWIGVLQQSALVRLVPPFSRNIGKRLVKSPKLYFLDSGLLCFLLRLFSPEQLERHPLRGAVFESFVFAEMLKFHYNHGHPDTLHFYRDREGLETDFLVARGDGVILVEAKSSATFHPELAKGIDRVARLVPQIGRAVVFGGEDEPYSFGGTTVCGWRHIGGWLAGVLGLDVQDPSRRPSGNRKPDGGGKTGGVRNVR